MLTRCPQCETIFRVSKKHISAAKGLVRCGSCKDIFNAKEHVIKSKKDLKKSAEPTTTKVEVHATSTTKVAEPAIKPKVQTTSTARVEEPVIVKEADSFDFLNDGFTSTGDFKKFNTSKPVNKPLQNKKPTSKAEAIERAKKSNLSFDSIFEEKAPKVSTQDSFVVKKPAIQKTIVNTKKDTIEPATFKSKTTQPHKATAVKPRLEKKSDTTGNFISQNVIDIKNAFSSLSKKISAKVSNKINQQEKQSDEVVKKSLKNKLNKSKIVNKVEQTVVETAALEKKSVSNRPGIMSLNSDTNVFESSFNTTAKNTAKVIPDEKKPVQKKSAPKIKTKPRLKEDAALKLAQHLKKVAQEKERNASQKKLNLEQPQEIQKKSVDNKKQKSDKDSSIKDENLNQAAKLNVVDITATIRPKLVKTNNKSIQNEEPKSEPVAPVPEATEEKRENKDSSLISKEESELEPELDDILDGDLVHIHMETMDIPMVLRESLEEFDLPSRSIEMTAFMIISLILLCFGLLLQFSIFRSIEVQQDYPILKPLVTEVCKTFNCDYSGPRDIKKIQLVSRDIRVHPNTKGALLISATIINNANFQQPYPNFSVKLSSLSGKTVAQRFFSPTDYLGKLSNKLLLMPPKQPIRIALEVVDPGKEAINFEFKFISIK